NVRRLENRADRDGELLTARATLPDALSRAAASLRHQLVGTVAAAVGARRAVRPAERFKQFAGGILVRKVLSKGRQVRGRSRHEASLRMSVTGQVKPITDRHLEVYGRDSWVWERPNSHYGSAGGGCYDGRPCGFRLASRLAGRGRSTSPAS